MSDAQPPIEDYALIADGYSAALVSRGGSIDWCCLGRVDGESCFSRLVDVDRGGFFSIAPAESARVTRRYLDRTVVLDTVFETKHGKVRLTDFIGVTGGEGPPDRLVRIVDGVEGTVPIEVGIAPRFAFGKVTPWVRKNDDGLLTAIGGDLALVIYGDGALERRDDHDIGARFDVAEGDRRVFALHCQAAHELYPEEPARPELDAQAELDRTVGRWRRWADLCKCEFEGAEQALRSALIVKALTYRPSGAIAAAATTSLPEKMGGGANWDYRLTWLRDGSMAIKVMGDLGFDDVAHGFRYFIERTSAGVADELQPLYGLAGESLVSERELHELDGYRGSKPVRVGNDAEAQRQLDIYGELLEVAYEGVQRGQEPDAEYWHMLRSTVELVAERWEQPDAGIWEKRGENENFTHSKVMCWVAVDRALRLADRFSIDVPRKEWTELAETIRSVVEDRGYDHERGVFVRAFGSKKVDCSLLLLPRVGFVDFRDERMVRTVDEIRRKLEASFGLLYRHEDAKGQEGAFIACSFWLAEVLAHQGRVEDAQKVFDRAASVANDVGLLSEMVDPDSGELLGNVPQGLSHYSHISALLALGRGRGAGQGG